MQRIHSYVVCTCLPRRRRRAARRMTYNIMTFSLTPVIYATQIRTDIYDSLIAGSTIAAAWFARS